jgi:hypothetical protein
VSDTNRWWVSWYATKSAGPFTLHTPWWESGWRMSDDAGTVVAAVLAPTEDAAKEVVLAAHDARPAALEWRFVNSRPADWTPFCDRFQRANWMRWPETP